MLSTRQDSRDALPIPSYRMPIKLFDTKELVPEAQRDAARRSTLAQRFWAKVSKGSPNECWLWNAGKTVAGYGCISAGGAHVAPMLLAHRVSWELHNGKIPEGLWVLHRCDVPGCVNPSHLFLGTQLENIADMNEKGRHNNGQSAKPHCSNGHAFDSVNTYMHGNKRQCRACHRTSALARYHRRALAGVC